MKIKTKLRLGYAFLFLMVLFFGALSGFYLKEITQNLRNNFEVMGVASRDFAQLLRLTSLQPFLMS